MARTAPRWNEVVAVFGGRFDPPHLGHSAAIQGLFENPGVGRVLILPSPTPPHKPALASFEDRVAMARIAFLQGPLKNFHVELDLREGARARLRPDLPTYSFETLQELRREIPELAFVIGTDQLEQFHTWHRFPEILQLCHWIVLAREPDGLALGMKTLAEWEGSHLIQKAASSTGIQAGLWSLRGEKTFLTLVPTRAPAISSTTIREQIARTGEPGENTLHPAILAYLKQNGLYGIRKT